MSFLTNRVKRDFLETCARIEHGTLRLRTPEGEVYDFGSGHPAAEMLIRDWSVVTAIASRGDVGLGETYVAGLWDTHSIESLAEVALRNYDRFAGYAYAGFWVGLKFRFVDRLMRANSLRGASRNIRAHYDVGNEFYQLWLDEGMTYSSALYAAGDDDLEHAQNRKYDRILDRVRDAERILEIGCGWGGFAERAAGRGQHVTGLTISPSQKGYADARLDGRAEIRLQDYRATGGTFDSIVSIEMIEAVGQRYWPAYFATLKARLSDGGTCGHTGDHGFGQLFRNLQKKLRLYPAIHLPWRHASVRFGDQGPGNACRACRDGPFRIRTGLCPDLSRMGLPP